MTTAISKPVVTHQPMHQYHLNDADRQAIIQQSSSSKKLMKIERQRLNFVEKFGCEFGLKIRQQRECGEDAGVVRHRNLRADCHCQKGTST